MADKIMDKMSISTNSHSSTDSEDSELRPPRKKKTKNVSKRKYKVKIAHVPKRCFDNVQRRIRANKSVIGRKTQTIEKEHCDRFSLAQVNSNQMAWISPESITRLMWEMKNSLQRQDYGDLAKLISMFTEMPIGKSRWYSTLLRYCLIVLLYDPLVKGTGLMDLFLEGVVGCRSESDKREFLQEINQLPKNIHVTKYEDLWEDYPTPNQLDENTLNRLCETLNKRLNLGDDDTENPNNVDDSEDDDSDWESYDENVSTANEITENETTEGELPRDLNEAMDVLHQSLIE